MSIKQSRPARLGIVMLAVTLVLFVVLFSKGRISTALTPGQTISAHFSEGYKVRKFVSVVKVGFVPVGKVKDVKRAKDGSAIVLLKVDKDVLKTLGSAPSATIRSTTLLGGNYFVELARGGDDGAFTAGSIPESRTKTPVELDKVARALQPDALGGLQSTIGNVDETLQRGGDDALRRLVERSPDTLEPLGRVLTAAQGEAPQTDLSRAVTGLGSTARVLTRTQGQLDSILVNLDVTSRVVAGRSDEISSTLAVLPTTLRNTDAGLKDLETTMKTLRDVSSDTRPVARELSATLEKVDPVLSDARPLVSDLQVVVDDARPLVQGLVPSVDSANAALNDVRGPVIKRVNGPVTKWLHAEYKGTGEYRRSTSTKPMFEEIVFALSNAMRATSTSDRNGHTVSFQVGTGAGSVVGLPLSMEKLFTLVTEGLWLDKPVETVPPLSRSGGKSKGVVPNDLMENLQKNLILLGGGL